MKNTPRGCLAAGGSQPPRASACSVYHSVSDCKHSNSDIATTATPDCEPGNYSIDVYGAEARNYEITSYTGGILSIVTWILDDANGDGDVDIADAVCVVNHVVGKPNTTFNEAAADANGDGDIDIADAVHIVNLVVGKIPALAPKIGFALPEPE